MLRPIPPSPSTEFFEAIAHRYDHAYALPTSVSRERMPRVLAELPPRARILDLGIGTGRELPALLDAGHSVTGVDASPTMLARCATRARKVPLILADFWLPLSFDDGSFDAVIALHGTLAHPPDAGAIARLAREALRVLARGGLFLVEVPSPGWLDVVERGDATAEEMRAVRTGPDTYRHEDLKAGVAIEARVLSEQSWKHELEGLFAVTVQPVTEVEQLVVARAFS